MKRILFVDDEPKVLEGLQRMLRPMRPEWDMVFVGSGPEALEALAKSPFDVVVSDMRMPGIDGAQLLAEVMKRYPEIVRIVLSGYSDGEMVMKSFGPAHQYLSKPCDAELLKATVGRACSLRDFLADKTLKRVVSQMQSLPSLPALYLELLRELQLADASIKRIAEIISKDIGMTAKILQLINSAFFGIRERVSSPVQAASLLGLDMIRALVLSVHVFSQFNQAKLPSFSLNALWSHSCTVGKFSQQISRTETQESKVSADALMAGLLHDSGKLVLATNLPQEYGKTLVLARNNNTALAEAERETFGTTHAEVGAYLLGLWGLPHSIVEAVAFHHRPSQCLGQAFSPLTAVHVANTFERELDAANTTEATSALDPDYLARLGLSHRVPAWREICWGARQRGDN